MRVAFFADTQNGRYAGFCPLRSDGTYASLGFEPTEHLIDILECRTFNDAKRHANYLAAFRPEDGVDEWGEGEL